MNKPSIQSVAKAFSVLEYVLESSMISDGTGLAEIAERFGMQKTTARNMMQTLEFCGYIRRKERGLYAPGEKCAMLCKAGSFAERIRPIALPLLKSAAEETGDSFILTTLFNGERLMIASVSGNSVISVNPEAVERERKFNYSRVTTHVLLAFAPETERKMFLESNPVPPGAWPEMEHELAEIRRRGICAKDRTDNGFFAAARPVYTRKNVFIGALGGYIPIAEATPEKNAGLCRVLDRIAQEITNLTGELS